MADRLRRVLAQRWLQTLIPVIAGVALGVWFFFGLGFPTASTRSDVPPQAAVSLTDSESEPSTAPDAAELVPSAGDPSAEQTAEEASPFAAIDEPPPTPAGRTGLVTHTVVQDEVLWQIAEQYGLRSETILWVNDLANPDLLLIGQQLVIPPQDGVLYTVQQGDRLADVAERYGVDLGAIVSSNQLGDANQLVAGSDVFLPGGRPLAARPAITTSVEARPDAEQSAAVALPPVPLPANVDALLQAGWLRAQHPTQLYRSGDPNSAPLQELPGGARLERLDGFRGGRVQVRDPGDGRTRQAMTGWANAVDLEVGRAPGSRELPLAYPADTAMDISHVFAPYRTQLDGSPYSEANCGPTAIGMALDAFGISVPSRQLRAETLNAQRMWGNGVGTLITALASVVRQHGLNTLDLQADGATRRWTLDDIRAHIQQGHPVIVQVRYRSLPGRGAVRFFGDHYILVTGVVGDSFLYNDPIDFDGLGWDRIMTGDRLRTAMDASDRRYAFAAFAVSR
jgi:LysM repeat protein